MVAVALSELLWDAGTCNEAWDGRWTLPRWYSWRERVTANRGGSEAAYALWKESRSKTTSPSFLFLFSFSPPAVTAATFSVLERQFFFLPLSPRFSLSPSLSCFLYYTGFLCMNSTAFKLPDLNTWMDQTTWQKKERKKRGGRTRVNHFMLYCVIKWRRPWITGHSHFSSPPSSHSWTQGFSHLMTVNDVMNTGIKEIQEMKTKCCFFTKCFSDAHRYNLFHFCTLISAFTLSSAAVLAVYSQLNLYSIKCVLFDCEILQTI